MSAEPQATQRTAELARDRLMQRDRASQHLGIEVLEVAPGRARLAMAVREDMLNGFDTCHGGVITTLADTAFALACNSHGEQTVASGLTIDFIAPARAGDVLVAQAREVALAGRSGVYDVEIGNQRGEPVAVFRGRSHRTSGRPSTPTAS